MNMTLGVGQVLTRERASSAQWAIRDRWAGEIGLGFVGGTGNEEAGGGF